MNDRAKHQEFGDWLASRISEADLTTEERKVFVEWLMKEIPSASSDKNTQEEHPQAMESKAMESKAMESKATLTMHDVRELFSWIKSRMKSTILNDGDRRQFNDWLIKRVTDNQSLDHNDVSHIKGELLD